MARPCGCTGGDRIGPTDVATLSPPDQSEVPVADPTTVVFLHAHPDDEAIFTGGTMRLLADRGVRVVLVLATLGEQGRADEVGRFELGARREAETRAAAEVLGIAAVHTLGYADSGVDLADAPDVAFATAAPADAAARLATILRHERADALVGYDDTGIYGHPDHVQVHVVGVRGAQLAGVATRYDATVDREYLHFVETHLVEEAGQSVVVPVGPLDAADAPFAPSLVTPPDHAAGGRNSLGLAATALGLPSVLIDHTVDVRSVIDVKRRAMLAHASQIPASSSAMRLAPAAFAEVYGYEWFARVGPPGPLDDLPHA